MYAILWGRHRAPTFAGLLALLLFWGCARAVRPESNSYPAPSAGTAVGPEELISAFRQGRAGNCASVAVIKLAMAKFGWDQVIKNKLKDTVAKTWTLKLHNDQIVRLTFQELEACNKGDHFECKNDPRVFAEARFLYAVIAKNKTGDTTSIDTQIKALNGGVNTKKLFPYLGLTELSLTLDDAIKKDQVIVVSDVHAAFSSKGFYDEYGTPRPLSEFKSSHRSWYPWRSSALSDAYQIKP